MLFDGGKNFDFSVSSLNMINYSRLHEVLSKISSGAEKVDMRRMSELVHKKVLELASNVSIKHYSQ